MASKPNAKTPITIPDHPNLSMYRDLSRTDPDATKPFKKGGGFGGTQIDPQWRAMRLTEYFGPVGQGWGGEQLAYEVAEGCVFVCARFWYKHPQTGEVCWTPPQWGGSELVKKRSDGSVHINDEAFKMAMTDAFGKCCALYLGLSADIYLGQFDGDKYNEENAAYYQAKNDPENSPERLAAFEKMVGDKLFDVLDLDQLDALWRSGISARVREIQKLDKGLAQRIISAFSQKKHQLLNDSSKEAAE